MVIDLKLVKILVFLLLLSILAFLLTFVDSSHDFVKFGLLVLTSLMVGLVFYAIRIVSKK
jgi:hypothetical protein